MKKPKMKTKDPDMLGTWPALLRAAARAKKLSIATGTPFYVMRNGKIVNLNPKSKRIKRGPRAVK